MNESVETDRVRFVLVGPQSAGNAGSAARALKNLGFSKLVLVDPQFDVSDKWAKRMAVDAAEVILGAEVHDDLDSALDGARTVVGASARVGRHRKPHWRIDAFSTELAALGRTGGLAFVFGREDSGLSDLELDRCTHLVKLPASEDYTSFNLAQAVLLVAYELRRSLFLCPPGPPGDPPARHGEREAMYRHLEQALLTIGYLQEDSVESIMRRFRRLFGRAGMTDEEVALLRGLARQTLWVAGQAGLPESGSGEDEP
jgi:TrmH family RNA methyltransferase